MGPIVVRDCSVLVVPATGACNVVGHQDLHIADGLIAAIVDTGSLPAPPGAEVIDAAGLIAVPGLTNAHSHSPMVLMRGAAEDVSVERWFNDKVWPMEVNLTPARVRVGARLAFAEMLLAGVTTVADHYFFAEEIAAAAIDVGIRANIAPTFFSSSAEHGRDAAFDAARALRALGSPLVTASLGPHAPYTVDEADLAATADIARAEGFGIHIHAAENVEQTVSSRQRLGVTPIEVLDRTGVLDAGALIAHGCGITEADLDLLAPHAARTAVASCPKVYLKHALSPVTPIRGLRAVGVTVAVGTDGAAGHNSLDGWEALRLLALVQKQQERDATWMPVCDVLRVAMRGGAVAAGLGAQTGALEVGRRADIALIDLDAPHNVPVHDPLAALVYSVRASDVVTVLVDGRVVVRERALVTADLPEILAAARAVAPALTDVSTGEAVQRYAP